MAEAFALPSDIDDDDFPPGLMTEEPEPKQKPKAKPAAAHDDWSIAGGGEWVPFSRFPRRLFSIEVQATIADHQADDDRTIIRLKETDEVVSLWTATEDQPARITLEPTPSQPTPSEAAIAMMVEAARTQQWPSIKLTGEPEFLRAAAVAAATAGIALDKSTPDDIQTLWKEASAGVAPIEVLPEAMTYDPWEGAQDVIEARGRAEAKMHAHFDKAFELRRKSHAINHETEERADQIEKELWQEQAEPRLVEQRAAVAEAALAKVEAERALTEHEQTRPGLFGKTKHANTLETLAAAVKEKSKTLDTAHKELSKKISSLKGSKRWEELTAEAKSIRYAGAKRARPLREKANVHDEEGINLARTWGLDRCPMPEGLKAAIEKALKARGPDAKMPPIDLTPAPLQRLKRQQAEQERLKEMEMLQQQETQLRQETEMREQPEEDEPEEEEESYNNTFGMGGPT